jgi:hypothetical protein
MPVPSPSSRPPAVLVLVLLLAPTIATAQDRSIPHPITPPPRFEAAIEQGTRTASGRPGPNYWTNRASYDIDATLSPATNTVMGQETIILLNSSGSHLQAQPTQQAPQAAQRAVG